MDGSVEQPQATQGPPPGRQAMQIAEACALGSWHYVGLVPRSGPGKDIGVLARPRDTGGEG